MEQKKMVWSRLKSNKCPKCNTDLWNQQGDALIKCTNMSCDFMVFREKFEQIVGKMYKRTVETPAYRGGMEAEDLQKIECHFCRSIHRPNEKCPGFD